MVEPDKAGVRGGATIKNGKSVAGGVPIDPGDVVGGETLGIGLTSGEGKRAGIGILDEFCDKKVDVGEADSLGIGPPVVRVGLKDDSFGGLIGAKAKGAGGEEAMRLFLGKTDVPSFEEGAVPKSGFELMLGKQAHPADGFKKGGVNFWGGEAHGESVDFFDGKFFSIDGEIESSAVGKAGVVDGLKGEDNIISREGMPVRPENPRAKMKSESFVVRGNFPMSGEGWLHLLGDRVIMDERVEEKADQSARGSVLGDKRVEGGGFARGGVDKNTASATHFTAGGVDSGGEGVVCSGHL